MFGELNGSDVVLFPALKYGDIWHFARLDVQCETTGEFVARLSVPLEFENAIDVFACRYDYIHAKGKDHRGIKVR